MRSFRFAKLHIAMLLALFAGTLFAPTALKAADVTARIRGAVTDPTNAVIPGANIIATNLLTGVNYTTVSQKDGTYFFAALPIGTYKITATFSGFETFTVSGITLAIDQEFVEPITLIVGDKGQVVSVVADSVQVNTTDMQINNIVESAQISELPNIGRNFQNLELIEPGVQASSDRFGGFSTNGGQTQQSSYLINGGDANDLALNTIGLSPILDAIGQFNLVTGPLNAEYDRNSGGIVNASLKTGTNHFHGEAHEFYRDTFLNTGNYFSYNTTTGTKDVTPFHQNIFGGTVGGPILKDKLFFFFGFEGTHQRVPNPNSGPDTTVLSAAQLAGNFSLDNPAGEAANANPLGNYFSTAPIPGTISIPGCPSDVTTWAGCAASNGGIFPTSSFNPIAAALVAKYLPAANSGSNGYVFNNVDATKAYQTDSEINFNPTSKDQFTGIWIHDVTNSLSTTPFTGATVPGFGEIDGAVITQATFDYIHQLNPTMLNDFAVHYTRFNDKIVDPETTVSPSSLGFSIFPQDVAAESVPTITTSYFSLGFSSNGPQPRVDETYQIDDSFSKSLGSHQLKFGYEGERFSVINPFGANNSGSFGFGSGTNFSSGDSGLDFLLGNPASYIQGSGATIQASAVLNYMYAQDTWKVSKTLTIDYGLGYQIDTPLHNNQYGGKAIICFIPGQQSTVFTTAPLGINYPGDPGCSNSGSAKTRYTDLGPRLGFAWAPNLGWLSGGDSKKFSVRGGFGIYYNRTEEETSLNNLEDAPFGTTSHGAADYGALAPGFANPYQDLDTGTVYANKFPFTFPTPGQTINYAPFEFLELSTYNKDFRSPYAENFQLTLSREFPSHTVATLSYVASLAHHNQITIEGNPETATGHAACLADTVNCGNPNSSGLRNAQSFYFPQNTQYGGIDPNTGEVAFTSIGLVTTEGASNYNSLQAGVTKSTSHGLEFQVSYTYAHALDDSSNYENAGYGGGVRGYNQFDHALNYGDSQYDARQRLVISPIYTVPLLGGHGALSPINLALAGWQVSGITTLATGFPFDISYSGGSSNSLYCSPEATYYACPDEPNQTGPLVRANPRKFVANEDATQWFVASASGLSQAPLGQFGNESRNRFHGPGLNVTNLILAKNFNLRAGSPMRLQIRMESDNVFNHTNFDNPASSVTSTTNNETLSTPGTLQYGTAGQITAAGASRLTQLAAKFYF
jgi:hypothetical protein